MAIAFSLMFLMLFIAYTTLLHFLTEDFKDQYIPARKLLFPWPSRGRFVSLLAIFAAGLFLIAVLIILRAPGKVGPPTVATFAILAIFVIFPLIFQSVYMYRGMTRESLQFPGQLAYKPIPFTQKDYRMLMVGVVAINGIGFVVTELRKYFGS